jgi:tetratricopeptide (TPR) repeat protein
LYLIAVVWFWFKDKRYFFALVFIFAAAAPSMAPVKISWLVAERYMFLGSFGGAALVGLIVERYWNKKYLTLALLSLVLAVYGWRTILRNIDWQTNHNLWVNTCQVSPNSHNAWNNIGDDYDKLAQLETTEEGRTRQYENAIKGFAQSFTIKPNYADAYHNQANILYKINRLDLARQAYELALYYNPDLYQTYLTLVQLDMVEGNKTELTKHLNNLLRLKPNDLQIYYMAAVAYNRVGMNDEAKKIADMLYQQFPNVKEIKDLYDSVNTQSKNLVSGTEIVEPVLKKD